MTSRLQASRAAIDLIKRFEGYRRTAARLDDGRWTIGYGHTKTARQGVEVSEADAEALLIYDLMEVAGALNALVYTPLNQNQFDALSAFVFNIGVAGFRGSNVLRRINEGSLLQAACAMEMWRKADLDGERIVVDALVRRRAAEKYLFLTPLKGFVPAPTAIVRPQIDQDSAGAVPAQMPVELHASLDGDRAIAERVAPAPTLRESEPASPTASEVASAALTARLQSILNEPVEDAPAPAAPPAPDAEPAVEPEIAPFPDHEAAATAPADPFMLTPPPAESGEAAPEPAAETLEADPTEQPLFTAEPLTFGDFESRRVTQPEFDEAELDQVPVEPIRSLGATPALIGLGILGLVVFAAAIFWGFQVKHSGDGGMFSSAYLIGWGLGLTGIACVATAVYFLLERLGGREEQ